MIDMFLASSFNSKVIKNKGVVDGNYSCLHMSGVVFHIIFYCPC